MRKRSGEVVVNLKEEALRHRGRGDGARSAALAKASAAAQQALRELQKVALADEKWALAHPEVEMLTEHVGWLARQVPELANREISSERRSALVEQLRQMLGHSFGRSAIDCMFDALEFATAPGTKACDINRELKAFASAGGGDVDALRAKLQRRSERTAICDRRELAQAVDMAIPILMATLAISDVMSIDRAALADTIRLWQDRKPGRRHSSKYESLAKTIALTSFAMTAESIRVAFSKYRKAWRER